MIDALLILLMVIICLLLAAGVCLEAWLIWSIAVYLEDGYHD